MSDMPRSFLVKSKKAHSYHTPRSVEEEYSRLEALIAHICTGTTTHTHLTHLSDTHTYTAVILNISEWLYVFMLFTV